MNSDYVLSFAQTEQDKEDIFQFRYKIFSEELRRVDKNIDHEKKSLRDPADDYAILLIAKDFKGQIVGTLRSIIRSEGAFEQDSHILSTEFKNVDKHHLSQTGRLAIAQEYRNSRLMRDMCVEMAVTLAERHVRYDFIYCKPRLISLYERLGYRRYTVNFRHSLYGYETPMVLCSDDREYLKNVKSPLYEPLSKFEIDSDGKWFEKTFPQFVMIGSSLHLKETHYWENVAKVMGTSLSDSFRMFKDINQDEINILLRKGHVITAAKGDKIIEYNEESTELFVIIEGEVAICHPKTQQILLILCKGETFGEMAFLAGGKRTADVFVRCDSTLLLLKSDNLKNLMEKRPDITSKLFYNISVLLAEHLQNANEIISHLQLTKTALISEISF